jgi:methionyl-tRNA formyltransferase
MVTPRSLRVVFLGTPAFAVPTLEALLASHHAVVGVVTQPDRPSGRGQKTTIGPVKAGALQNSVPLLQPATLKDPACVPQLAAWGADIGVVVAYGKILPEVVISTPRLGMINVHASLLPRYRGAAPIHRAVIAGETETGVTIMRVVKALDAGPMLAHVSHPIGENDTSRDVEQALAKSGARLLVTTLDQIAAGTAREQPQDEARATYAARITREDGIIDWTRPAKQIHDLVRGLHPWPHASSFLADQRLIIHRSMVSSTSPAGPPGTVVVGTGTELRVATGEGTLDLLEVQLEGKRPMAVHDFMAGHRIAAGARFSASP